MSYGVPAQGYASKVAVGDALPVNFRFEFSDENIVCDHTHLQTDGIRGTRQHIGDNVVSGTRRVGGTIKTKPTPAFLAKFLPYILGGTGSGGTNGTQYLLEETLPSFNLVKDCVTKVFTYSGMVVNKATFRGRKGEEVELELDLQGIDESVGAAGSFPTLTISTEQPFAFFASASGVTINGVGSRLMDDFELTIDNKLDLERFNNSQVRTALPPQDQEIEFKCTVPFTTDDVDLYNMSLPGLAASLVFVNGSKTIAFNMGCLQVPSKTPVVPGKHEIMLPLQGFARKLSSVDSLVIESSDS
jgi:hypothetical protein